MINIKPNGFIRFPICLAPVLEDNSINILIHIIYRSGLKTKHYDRKWHFNVTEISSSLKKNKKTVKRGIKELVNVGIISLEGNIGHQHYSFCEERYKELISIDSAKIIEIDMTPSPETGPTHNLTSDVLDVDPGPKNGPSPSPETGPTPDPFNSTPGPKNGPPPGPESGPLNKILLNEILIKEDLKKENSIKKDSTTTTTTTTIDNILSTKENDLSSSSSSSDLRVSKNESGTETVAETKMIEIKIEVEPKQSNDQEKPLQVFPSELQAVENDSYFIFSRETIQVAVPESIGKDLSINRQAFLVNTINKELSLKLERKQDTNITMFGCRFAAFDKTSKLALITERLKDINSGEFTKLCCKLFSYNFKVALWVEDNEQLYSITKKENE